MKELKTMHNPSRTRILLRQFLILLVAALVVDNLDGERATGAFGDLLALLDLVECYNELIAAGAWVEELEGVHVEVEVLDLHLVVDAGDDAGHC